MEKWEDMRDPRVAGQIELESWISSAPFEKLCGMKIIEARDGRARVRMDFRVKLSMGAGLMHGGAIASLADTAVAMAIKSLLPEGSEFLAREFRCIFLAPVRRGTIYADAKILKNDGKEIATEAVISDENGDVFARFEAPFKVLRAANLRD